MLERICLVASLKGVANIGAELLSAIVMDSILLDFFSKPRSENHILDVYTTIKKTPDCEFTKLSPSVVQRFILGSDGLIEQLRKSSNDPKTLIQLAELLLIFTRHDASLIESMPADCKVDLCCSMLSLMKKIPKDVEALEICLALIQHEKLISTFRVFSVATAFRDAMMCVYSSKTMHNMLKASLREFYFSILQTQWDQFHADPSLSNLKNVLILVDLGFILTRLAPDDYVPKLHIISGVFQRACHSDENGVPNWSGQINLSEWFMFPITRILRLLYSVLQGAPLPVLSIVKSLLLMHPQLAIEDHTFKLVLEILMHAVRLGSTETDSGTNGLNQPPDSSSLSNQPPQPAVLSLRLLVKLTDIWDQAQIDSDRHADMMNQLFDLLRVFPSNLEHAEVRLRAWWHFICRLPVDLLTDGFARFVSPFLANMLGRYLSLSAPLGDPQLHRYKLSQGNAYEGNARALELAQHVFACFFQFPLVSLHLLNGVPCPRIEPKTLANNSYQLLVALYYWIRLICGSQQTSGSGQPDIPLIPVELRPTQPVDQIWIGCVQCVLEAAARFPQSDASNPPPQPTLRSPSVVTRVTESVPLMVLQRVVHTTGQLICPSNVSLLADQRHAGLKTSEPTPVECLNIIEAVTDSTLKHPVAESDRVDVLFDLCVKSLELGSSWILPRRGLASQASKNITADVLTRWCDLTLNLIESDPRFSLENSGIGSTTGVDLIPLIRQLLSAFIPDCVNLAASNPSSSDLASQDSTMSIWLGQTPTMCYSPQGLRLWSALADRFTRFILLEQRVCEGDPVNSPDLTTIQAMLLSVFWLAGPTAPHNAHSVEETEGEKEPLNQTNTDQKYLSAKDELAAAKRLNTLFAAFHQEACLLTTVAANSWIDQLGNKLVTAVTAVMPDSIHHINFNLMGRFLHCLSTNAERLDETMDARAMISPFSWKSTQDRPFGYLTGLALALKLCLLHSPWFDPPNPAKSSRSPGRRCPNGHLARILSSPPPIAQLARCCSNQSEESSLSSELTQSQCSLMERVQACATRVSCGLIESLEAVTILIREHSRSAEMISWLVEILSPALLRLASCCVQAEAFVQDAATELDEPLLITQRRQQAKQALEEVFISLFRWSKIQPVVFPEQNPATILQVLSSTKGRSKVEKSSTNMVPYIADALRPALVLCGISINPVLPPSKDPTQLNRPFLAWLVGFWNALEDAWLATTSNIHLKCKPTWDKRSREQLHSILQDYEQPLLICLSTLNDTPSTPSVARRRGKQSDKMRTASARASLGGSRKLRVKIEEEEVHSEPRGRRGRSMTGPELDADADLSLAALKQELFASQTNPSKTVHTPSPPARRGRRSRLSLHRNPDTKESETTPVRQFSSSTNYQLLTRSAPSVSGPTKRGRGRPSLLRIRSPHSSPHTPRGGILASTLGINLDAENHSIWSPNKASPDPLPAKPLVKRRLFVGATDKKETSPNPDLKTMPNRRKRLHSDSDASEGTNRTSSFLEDFEESAQFVFIPPKPENNRKRRRTVGSLQNGRTDEKRDNYLPVTYTELDSSQQSWPGAAGGSDSQSGSQSHFSQPSWDQFRTALRERLAASSSAVSMEQQQQQPEPQVSTQQCTTEAAGTANDQLGTVQPSSTDENITEERENVPMETETEAASPPSPMVSSGPKNESCENATLPTVDFALAVDETESSTPQKKATNNVAQTSASPTEAPPETATPPNTPQRLAPDDPLSTNTTPTSYLRKLSSGLRTAADAQVLIPPVLNLNHPPSPLIRNMASSRAQRMLALGLKKAAEQTARPKPNPDSSSSEATSPERVAPASPIPTRPTDQTGSPSGILRNLWSRKKAQRVSFAEQPVVFTFGRASQSPIDNDNSPGNDPSADSNVSSRPTGALNDITGCTLNTGTHEPEITGDTAVTKADENSARPVSTPIAILKTVPEVKINHIEIQAGERRLSLPLHTRVDLDASQSSQDGTPVAIKRSESDTFSTDSALRHRRKSNSPQRRIIPVRLVPTTLLAGSNLSPRSLTISVPSQRHKQTKRRSLFNTDSAPHSVPVVAKPPLDPYLSDSVVPDTEPEERREPAAGLCVPESEPEPTHQVSIVPDSEAMVIADTQEPAHENHSENVKQTTEITLETGNKSQDLVTDMDTEQIVEECMVIESSQADEAHDPVPNSSALKEIELTRLSPKKSEAWNNEPVSTGVSDLPPPPSVSTETPPEDPSPVVDVLQSPRVKNESSVAQSLSLSDDISAGLDSVDGPNQSDVDVEAEIRASLSQIATKLADLPAARHQAVLLDVLSTFKSLMH